MTAEISFFCQNTGSQYAPPKTSNHNGSLNGELHAMIMTSYDDVRTAIALTCYLIDNVLSKLTMTLKRLDPLFAPT